VHFEFTVDQVIELAALGVRRFKDSGLSVFFLQQLLHAVDRSTFAIFSAYYNALYRAVREQRWDRAVALERKSGEVFRLCGGPYNVPMWHALFDALGVDASVSRLP
jgi:dihydrodipicolinate synthase/N-acetylneuraminate lyase